MTEGTAPQKMALYISLDSGDSLGRQEDRGYLKNEETEAQRVKGKGLSMVSVAAGAPKWVSGFAPPVRPAVSYSACVHPGGCMNTPQAHLLASGQCPHKGAA